MPRTSKGSIHAGTLTLGGNIMLFSGGHSAEQHVDPLYIRAVQELSGPKSHKTLATGSAKEL